MKQPILLPGAKGGRDENVVNGPWNSVSRTERNLGCCIKDGRRPPEFGLQELISNRLVLLHLRDVVVSDQGKVS